MIDTYIFTLPISRWGKRASEGIDYLAQVTVLGEILHRVKNDFTHFGTRLPPRCEPGTPFNAHREIVSNQSDVA